MVLLVLQVREARGAKRTCNVRGEFTRRPAIQAAVRTKRVVPDPPVIGNLLGFAHVGEQFHVQALVSETAVEALDEWILPRAAGRDEDALAPVRVQPRRNRARSQITRRNQLSYVSKKFCLVKEKLSLRPKITLI